MSQWITAHAQWQAWAAELELKFPPVTVIDEFDHELRGVLDGMFGPALEATSVEMVKEGQREDSMTTLIRHRDDIVRPTAPPEEFDAASTLVHAPRVEGDPGGFDVAVSTPGGGFEIELQPHSVAPEDGAFFIPALTESARIVVVDAPTESQGPPQSIDGNGASATTVSAPDLGAIEPPPIPAALTVPTIVAEPPPETQPLLDRDDALGPIGWAEPPPEPAMPVRSGTTLIPTDPPASSSQTAGVIVSLDGEDGLPPPRRKSKIVIQSDDSAPEDIAAQAYDDSGEYPRPVPSLEPGVEETELEEGDLDAADLDDDSADGDGPPRPPAPKPAVHIVTGEHPPVPPRPETPTSSPTPPPPTPPPPPRAEVPPLREVPRLDAAPPGPPPPPPVAKEPARTEVPPPPPPRPAVEAARESSEAASVEPPPLRTGSDAPPPPRVRTLPGVSGPHWSDAVFTEHFFALVRPGGPRIAATEVAFLQEALGLGSGSTVIDVGCGDGWHAQLLAERGMRVVGLDSSEPMIRRATELAEQNGVRVRWMLGDVRQRVVEETFDAVLCLGTSFGYDDEPTNRKMMQAMRDLVRVGGRLALHVVNRDYVVPRLPARSWWQGDRCLVLDEVDMQDWSSRVRVRRTIVFEDGGQFEHTLSIRVYALHELIALVEEQGLRVVEVSGSPHTRGRFYGATSPDIWVMAERVDDR